MSEFSPEYVEKNDLERKYQAVNSFIAELMYLFKSGNYQAVIDLAHSDNRAQTMGINLVGWESSRCFYINKQLSQKELNTILFDISRYSWCHHNNIDPSSISIHIADYACFDKNIKIPKDFQRCVAELCIEEWTHALQYLNKYIHKTPSLTGLSDDTELDVAAYMIQKGMKLSDLFLSKAGRQEFLLKTKLI